MRHSIYNNIHKLYLIKLAKWFMLIMPVVALFYVDNGLDDVDIYLLQGIYSLSVALMEIPSGYMADSIGRKKSLIAGSVLGTLGFIVYSLSTSFAGFLVAEIILGLGGSFISGSDSALLYDSLAAENEEHNYLRYEGRITSLGNFAETSAAIAGGLIATLISYRAVYISQALVAAIAIPAALLLVEPPRARLAGRPGIRQISAISYQALFKNRRLASTILFSSAVGTATLCMAWTCQVYFVHMGLTEQIITPLWVGLNLTVAVVSAYAFLVQKWLGRRKTYLATILVIPLGYILVGSLPLVPALLVLFLFYGVRGFATPLVKDLINHNCESSTRATVLSIRSMIIRVSFSIMGPIIGHLSKAAGLEMALVLAGCAFLVATISSAWMLNRHLPETMRG